MYFSSYSVRLSLFRLRLSSFKMSHRFLDSEKRVCVLKVEFDGPFLRPLVRP